MHLEPGVLEATCDVTEPVPVTRQRQPRPLRIRTEHRFTTAALEREQQVAPRGEHPTQLGETAVECLGRRVDDRVPADDAGQRAPVERELVEAPLLELDTGV